MGLVVDGLMDLGTHIWHPLQIFLQGRMTSQREREPGIEIGLGLFDLFVLHWAGLPKDKEPGDIKRTL